MRFSLIGAALAATFVFAVSIPEVKANELGKWFTHLSVVDPSIKQDMRYYGDFNFLGAHVDGYEAAECILTKRAAAALQRVQVKALQRGYSLKVHDCYRPKKAVAHFVRWAKDQHDLKTRDLFYPREDKALLFKRGYIAHKSGHSRGSTVDLTLVGNQTQSDEELHYIEDNGRPCHDNPIQPNEIGVVEMGTRFDCLDIWSATASPHVSETARQNRLLLKELMTAEGFKNYTKEWWHYSLIDEPFRKTYQDFPVGEPGQFD
jgi:D-alanyl-D-alanine dipeptidase